MLGPEVGGRRSEISSPRYVCNLLDGLDLLVSWGVNNELMDKKGADGTVSADQPKIR